MAIGGRSAGHLLHYLGFAGSVFVKLRPHQRIKKNLVGYIDEMSRRLDDATEKCEGEQKDRVDSARFALSILKDVDEKDIFQHPSNCRFACILIVVLGRYTRSETTSPFLNRCSFLSKLIGPNLLLDFSPSDFLRRKSNLSKPQQKKSGYPSMI